MNDKEAIIMTDYFKHEFNSLLEKYCIDDFILCNNDDGNMGYYQLIKIFEAENRRVLSMKFSGKNETLCECCAQKENHE